MPQLANILLQDFEMFRQVPDHQLVDVIKTAPQLADTIFQYCMIVTCVHGNDLTDIVKAAPHWADKLLLDPEVHSKINNVNQLAAFLTGAPQWAEYLLFQQGKLLLVNSEQPILAALEYCPQRFNALLPYLHFLSTPESKAQFLRIALRSKLIQKYQSSLAQMRAPEVMTFYNNFIACGVEVTLENLSPILEALDDRKQPESLCLWSLLLSEIAQQSTQILSVDTYTKMQSDALSGVKKLLQISTTTHGIREIAISAIQQIRTCHQIDNNFGSKENSKQLTKQCDILLMTFNSYQHPAALMAFSAQCFFEKNTLRAHSLKLPLSETKGASPDFIHL